MSLVECSAQSYGLKQFLLGVLLLTIRNSVVRIRQIDLF
jgi:hypothetical protein